MTYFELIAAYAFGNLAYYGSIWLQLFSVNAYLNVFMVVFEGENIGDSIVAALQYYCQSDDEVIKQKVQENGKIEMEMAVQTSLYPKPRSIKVCHVLKNRGNEQ